MLNEAEKPSPILATKVLELIDSITSERQRIIEDVLDIIQSSNLDSNEKERLRSDVRSLGTSGIGQILVQVQNALRATRDQAAQKSLQQILTNAEIEQYAAHEAMYENLSAEGRQYVDRQVKLYTVQLNKLVSQYTDTDYRAIAQSVLGENASPAEIEIASETLRNNARANRAVESVNHVAKQDSEAIKAAATVRGHRQKTFNGVAASLPEADSAYLRHIGVDGNDVIINAETARSAVRDFHARADSILVDLRRDGANRPEIRALEGMTAEQIIRRNFAVLNNDQLQEQVRNDVGRLRNDESLSGERMRNAAAYVVGIEMITTDMMEMLAEDVHDAHRSLNRTRILDPRTPQTERAGLIADEMKARFPDLPVSRVDILAASNGLIEARRGDLAGIKDLSNGEKREVARQAASNTISTAINIFSEGAAAISRSDVEASDEAALNAGRGARRRAEGLGINEDVAQALGRTTTVVLTVSGRVAIQQNYNQQARDLLETSAVRGRWLNNDIVNNGASVGLGGATAGLQDGMNAVAGLFGNTVRDNRIHLEEIQGLFRSAGMSTELSTYNTDGTAGLSAAELNAAIARAERRIDDRNDRAENARLLQSNSTDARMARNILAQVNAGTVDPTTRRTLDLDRDGSIELNELNEIAERMRRQGVDSPTDVNSRATMNAALVRAVQQRGANQVG